MHTRFKWAVLLASLVTGQAGAFTLFSCEPEWTALARVLVPEARIYTATHAGQDPHHIEARPALIAQMRSADMAVCTGAALEGGWLPMLQERSGNRKIQDGAPGMFYAADHALLIDPQPDASGNPFAGDVHAEGNPHLHADPRNILEVAAALSAQLQALLPNQAQAIGERHTAFEVEWKRRIQGWEERARPLRGMEVAAQHTAFGYLWNWLGIRQVADLEPRPGMAPTPGHLQRLLQTLARRPPVAIVTASYQDQRSARWLVERLPPGTPLLTLPPTVAAQDEPQALAKWFDQLLDALLRASGK